jgi:hypothetical protein
VGAPGGGGRSISTFSMGQVYQALGIRDPRVNPSIPTGALLPVIVLGQLTAFTPQVIEARSTVNGGPFNLIGGQWVALLMQSIAPGGTIIEQVHAAGAFNLSIGSTKPFIGVNLTPFSIGGQQVQNLYEQTGIIAGPTVPGDISNGNAAVWPHETTIAGGPTLEGIWVPPAFFFWMTLIGPNANHQYAMRMREIPQAQGPA